MLAPARRYPTDDLPVVDRHQVEEPVSVEVHRLEFVVVRVLRQTAAVLLEVAGAVVADQQAAGAALAGDQEDPKGRASMFMEPIFGLVAPFGGVPSYHSLASPFVQSTSLYHRVVDATDLQPGQRRQMFLRQIFDPELAQYAYLIGCQRTEEAIVIDPERDIDRYVDIAAQEDLLIVAATETHIHADFLSGTREFAERHGVL